MNAEDVTGGAFRPSPGLITALSVPNHAGVRFDGGYEAGDEVLPYYDSLIGKLVVWAPTREHAIDRALVCLSQFTVSGVPTTIPAAKIILDHPDFRAVKIGTRWLENHIDLDALLEEAMPAGDSPSLGEDGAIDANDEESDRQEVWVGGRRYRIPLPMTQVATVTDTSPEGAAGAKRRGSGSARGRARAKAAGSGTVSSPMQGTVIKVNVTEGQQVAENEVIAVMEAMKMENPVRATVAGVVSSVLVQSGQVVPAGTVIAEIAPAGD